MKETIEQICQRLLDQRGYLVMDAHRKYRVGEVVPRISSWKGDLEHPTVVISETNIEDLLQQCKMAGVRYGNGDAPYFYRVIAE